jgi:hypothetical protein
MGGNGNILIALNDSLRFRVPRPYGGLLARITQKGARWMPALIMRDDALRALDRATKVYGDNAVVHRLRRMIARHEDSTMVLVVSEAEARGRRYAPVLMDAA